VRVGAWSVLTSEFIVRQSTLKLHAFDNPTLNLNPNPDPNSNPNPAKVEGAAELLKDGSARVDNVQRDLLLGRKYGVNGVPFFVINKQYGLSGAQVLLPWLG
jgi:hypothetical protein